MKFAGEIVLRGRPCFDASLQTFTSRSVVVGQRLHQHAVDHREDRAVGADAERQREMVSAVTSGVLARRAAGVLQDRTAACPRT